MAAEPSQIPPPSPSANPTTPVPSSNPISLCREPPPPPEDAARTQENEAPPQKVEAAEGAEEGGDQEEDEEGLLGVKRRRISAPPAVLAKAVSFTFDVRTLAAPADATPRFGSEAFSFLSEATQLVEERRGEGRGTAEEEVGIEVGGGDGGGDGIAALEEGASSL